MPKYPQTSDYRSVSSVVNSLPTATSLRTPATQWAVLACSMSHVIAVIGWHQEIVLRRHGLEPRHMALLLQSDRNGSVSFDDVRRRTQLSIHPIRRAAYRLDGLDLGSVRFAADRRRRYFRINKKGRELLRSIESETATALMVDIGAVGEDGRLRRDSKRYFDITVAVSTLTSHLPDAGCAHHDIWKPTRTSQDEDAMPWDLELFQRPAQAPATGRR